MIKKTLYTCQICNTDYADKEKAIATIKEVLINDKDQFDRKHSAEAFADNFARMYGYGPYVISGLHKGDKHIDKHIKSRYEKEEDRQEVIFNIILASLKGVHKTDMHRAHNLIKEYEADLKDPKIPVKVKESIKQDLEELNKIVDRYLNSSDDFSNQLNKMIYEELKKMDPAVTEDSKDVKKV